MKYICLLASAAMLALSGAANATLAPGDISVGWSFTNAGASTPFGSGTFTASLADSGTLDGLLLNSSYDLSRPQDFYLVTDVDGTINGHTITSGQSLVGVGGFAGNDNLLLLTGSPTALTFGDLSSGGVSFSDEGGTSWNFYLYETLFDQNVTDQFFGYQLSDGTDSSPGVLTMSLLVGPPSNTEVPLPAAAWLLLSGLGSLGALGRRRLRRS